MMQVKTIKMKIQSFEEMAQHIKKRMQKLDAGKKIKPEISLGFSDLDTMRSCLTQNRLGLLKIIKKEKPTSLYQLAELAKRDFKNVYEDLKTLKELGLVECSTNNKNKKNVVPTLLYSGLNLHFTF